MPVKRQGGPAGERRRSPAPLSEVQVASDDDRLRLLEISDVYFSDDE